jgi:hypothetical protein
MPLGAVSTSVLPTFRTIDVYTPEQISDLKRLQILWAEMLGKTMAMQGEVNAVVAAGISVNARLEQHRAQIETNHKTVGEMLARINAGGADDVAGDEWKHT